MWVVKTVSRGLRSLAAASWKRVASLSGTTVIICANTAILSGGYQQSASTSTYEHRNVTSTGKSLDATSA